MKIAAASHSEMKFFAYIVPILAAVGLGSAHAPLFPPTPDTVTKTVTLSPTAINAGPEYLWVKYADGVERFLKYGKCYPYKIKGALAEQAVWLQSATCYNLKYVVLLEGCRSRSHGCPTFYQGTGLFREHGAARRNPDSGRDHWRPIWCSSLDKHRYATRMHCRRFQSCLAWDCNGYRYLNDRSRDRCRWVVSVSCMLAISPARGDD